MATIVYLTSKQYANFDGKFCPYCGSKHFVTLGPVDVDDDGTGYQHMCCQGCGKKWYNQYRLVGFIPSKWEEKMMQKMHSMHEAKVDELIKNMAKALKDTCRRLYSCRGIDVKKYSPENFVLAKILVSVAMEQCKGNLRPLFGDFNKDFKNLLHF